MGVIGGGWMQWCVVTRSDTRRGHGGGTGGPGRTYMVKVGVWRDSYYMGVGRGYTGEQ